MQKMHFWPCRGFPSEVLLFAQLVCIIMLAIRQWHPTACPSPAPTAAAKEGFPLAAGPLASGSQALASNILTEALSPAPAMPEPAALPVLPSASRHVKPGQHPLPALTPSASRQSPDSHKQDEPAKPIEHPPASMEHTAAIAPLPAQPRRLTAVPSLPASPSPPAAAAASYSAAQAPAPDAETPSALSAPRAAPLRSPTETPSILPPILSRHPQNPPKLAAPAPLHARQSAAMAPTLDQEVTAALGSVAAATAAAGLAEASLAHQAISPAQPPSHSPRPAISLRGPLHAQAFRAASQAPAPGLLSQRKPASPFSTAPAASPAELAQIKKREEAAENMKAASTMVDSIEAAGYAAVPQVALSTTPAPPVSEQPPIPVNVTSKETESAVLMLLRVSGSGVTPITPQKQQQLINVFVDATAGNLSASQFRVLLVTSAFSARHRSLLQAPVVALGSSKGTPLKDVVDVRMEVSAGTPDHATTVRNQLAGLISGRSYLDMALQRAGLNTWSIKVLTISVVKPSQSSGMLPCQTPFGRWCLDKSALTIPVVILTIAFGGALVVFSIILVIVIREVKKNSGRTAGLEYPKNDSTTIKTHVLKYVIGDHAHPSSSQG